MISNNIAHIVNKLNPNNFRILGRFITDDEYLHTEVIKIMESVSIIEHGRYYKEEILE